MYVCKFQIYRTTGLFQRESCKECSADVINNPKCPDYKGVELKDMELLGRVFKASKLEKEVK